MSIYFIIFQVAQIGNTSATDILLKLATLGIILLITWIVSRLLAGFVSKTSRKLTPSVAQLTRRITIWLTWLIGILIALSQIGLESPILLVSIALAGIIIAIALRNALSDLVSYEVINSFEQFKIGHWILVEKYFGRVIDITWMDTVLMTADNEIVHIPNSKITQSIIVNKTAPGGTRISVTFLVDKTLDISKVESTLLNIGAELEDELIPDFKPEVRVISLNAHSVKLALLLRVNNPARVKLIASNVRKRAKERLDKITKNDNC